MPATQQFRFEHMGIGSLLKRERLIVPPNQRPYAWKEEHVLDLLHDLNSAIGNSDPDYFLGTVVLTSGNGLPEVTDGQQRLATTTILLARIRDQLFELKADAQAQQIETDYIRNIDLESGEKVPKLRLNTEDNSFFAENIIARPAENANERPAASAPSNTLLVEASDLIAGYVVDLLKSSRADEHAKILVRWIKFIESAATIVVVTVPDAINAYRMFETLNDRGLRASQADLLKNYFFSKAGASLAEAQRQWAVMKDQIDNIGDDDRLITFLRHLWITKKGPTKERELAEQIRKDIGGETKTLAFLSDAGSAAHDYAALFLPTHQKWREYDATALRHLETITDHLQVEQIRPLLFAVARHFDPKEAVKAFKLFVSWSVRFLIVGGRGGKLDTHYSHRSREVGAREITKARELRESMRQFVPTDAEFQQAFATARVSRPHLARYYLRALDLFMANNPEPTHFPNSDTNTINLEHVLPLTPSSEWAVDEEVASTAQKRLGNMALMQASKNVLLGNSAFDQKRAAYGSSQYRVTNMIAEYDEWGMDQINDRQAKLAAEAVKTWSLAFDD